MPRTALPVHAGDGGQHHDTARLNGHLQILVLMWLELCSEVQRGLGANESADIIASGLYTQLNAR